MSPTAVPMPGVRPDTGEEEFRRFMSRWPTGVTIVTTLDADRPTGCTVNAMMSVSLAPPLLVVALAETSTTLHAVLRTGAFGLNVLAGNQRDLCRRFARGTHRERFCDVPYLSRYRMPMLCDVVAASVCTVHDTVRCGDHTMVIGAPVWFTAGGQDSPLVFHQRGYHELVAPGGGS